jgi:hypothetical protein
MEYKNYPKNERIKNKAEEVNRFNYPANMDFYSTHFYENTGHLSRKFSPVFRARTAGRRRVFSGYQTKNRTI